LSIDIPDGALSLVDSCSAYHQVNFDVLRGVYPGLGVPGRNFGNGVIRARGSRFPGNVPTKGQTFVGAFCHVDQGVELLEDVILSDGVIVDSQASVKSSVILPYSYVGQSVELMNAIVCPPYLIRVDTGAVTRVTDAFLICDLKRSPMRSWASKVTNRFIGMLLLLLSAPLWPIALIAMLFSPSGTRVRKRMLIGNLTCRGDSGEEQRREFKTAELAINFPVLRHLPKLWAVVMGHLRLIGVRPLSLKELEGKREEWERIRDQAPCGLLVPSQLLLSSDATVDECQVVEAEYATTRSMGKDLSLLVQGIKVFFRLSTWFSGGSIRKELG